MTAFSTPITDNVTPLFFLLAYYDGEEEVFDRFYPPSPKPSDTATDVSST